MHCLFHLVKTKAFNLVLVVVVIFQEPTVKEMLHVFEERNWTFKVLKILRAMKF